MALWRHTFVEGVLVISLSLQCGQTAGYLKNDVGKGLSKLAPLNCSFLVKKNDKKEKFHC